MLEARQAAVRQRQQTIRNRATPRRCRCDRRPCRPFRLRTRVLRRPRVSPSDWRARRWRGRRERDRIRADPTRSRPAAPDPATPAAGVTRSTSAISGCSRAAAARRRRRRGRTAGSGRASWPRSAGAAVERFEVRSAPVPRYGTEEAATRGDLMATANGSSGDRRHAIAGDPAATWKPVPFRHDARLFRWPAHPRGEQRRRILLELRADRRGGRHRALRDLHDPVHVLGDRRHQAERRRDGSRARSRSAC